MNPCNPIEQQAVQDRLEALYEADGRHDPEHPMHSTYTGLAQAASTDEPAVPAPAADQTGDHQVAPGSLLDPRRTSTRPTRGANHLATRTMTRTIAEHQINTCNEKIAITVLDEPGSGGANHLYQLKIDDERVIVLGFQNGPIAEVGVNGITHEALLAVLIDRLRGFQAGPFSCRENAITLTKLEEAQMWLHRRTAQRIERGVEGTHQV